MNNKVTKYIKEPKKIVLYFMNKGIFKYLPDEKYLKLKYYLEMGEKLDLENLEKEKRKKYNPNDLFKNRNKNDNIEILEQPKQNAQIIEYQEPKWYQKIFAKLLNIFRKK